jgi:hypothetical protein
MVTNEQADCFLLTSFPAEMRLEVYHYILADRNDNKAQNVSSLVLLEDGCGD